MDDIALNQLVCRILGELDGWSYLPGDGEYSEEHVAVWYLRLHGEPARGVAVRVYGGDDSAGLKIRRVQFISRGLPNDPFGADRIAAQIYATFHEVSRADGIAYARRISFGPLGPDGNGREERSDNYELTLDNLEVLS